LGQIDCLTAEQSGKDGADRKRLKSHRHHQIAPAETAAFGIASRVHFAESLPARARPVSGTNTFVPRLRDVQTSLKSLIGHLNT